MKMKMNMRLRKPVMAFLFLTVLAPIVLYTDKLSTFSTDEFFQEPSSLLPSNPDATALNFLLPQESSTSLKEPMRLVYSENSTQSDTEKSRRTRQLNEESKGIDTNVTGDNQINPIRQVTANHGANEESPPVEKKSEKLKVPDLELKQAQAVEVSLKVSERKPANHRNRNEKRKQYQDEVLGDVRVRHLKDQLIMARVYLSLSATRTNTQFNRELRIRMKDVEKLLVDATNDSQLPNNANEKMKAMEQTLLKGRRIQDECSVDAKKLRGIIHSTEQQLRVQEKQTLFLTHLTAKTVPKGLHCLPLRLSADYYSLKASSQQFPNQDKLQDPNLFHYALFSDNVLATAVVVNSTISSSKDSSKHVFHIVTDKLNYAAMRMWFLANPPWNATIEVQNVDEFTWLNASYSPVLKQLATQKMIDYYFKTKTTELDSNLKFRNPKYLSMMNHLRFYLPEMFPKLNKVVFLDDDIVVQKDLTGLWGVDMKGKVNGAVETCGESFHRFDRYLNFSNPLIAKNFDPRACGWAYGMNLFDLEQWKNQNITDIYHSWQNLNSERELWKLGTLPPGLITFYGRVFPLERSWHVLGLGYNPNVSQKEIERAAVIHYNGNLKPWLEIGIPKFRGYWSRFVDYDHPYMRDCNITP
ncbi:probable galacturonosyltransferase 4 [Lactuca sativa]|uniref:probable galacturonosyltransferase 4 n=1 Tax=Lactuca sativa TaxID=4236 RepID=UPI000CD81C4C|nr:probable galacturonosyltransferase 4 [Lactuca sativa]